MRLFDLHCDTVTEASANGYGLRRNSLHVDLERGGVFERWTQVFAIFIPDSLRGKAAWDYYKEQLAFFRRQLAENADLMLPACRSGDMETAHGGGRMAAVLAVEGGAVLGGNAAKVGELYADGVRMLTLTWNGENELAGGSACGAGLKPAGEAVIAAMERVGMIADVSHLNDRSFWDVMAVAKKPVVASHSCARDVCGHPRNLDDRQFSEIVRRGGLVGVNLYKAFLNDKPENAGFDDVCRHISHFLALGGEDTLAIGSDFDGAELPESLNSIDKLPALRHYLMEKNLPGGILDKLFYDNAARFAERFYAGETLRIFR